MKKYEFTGKKLDITIEEALQTLNKKQEEVDINIITEGGLFKKCKIEVIVNDEEEVAIKQAPVATCEEEVKEQPILENTNETTMTKAPIAEPCEEKISACETEEETKEQPHENKYENRENATYAKTFIENMLEKMGATGSVTQTDTPTSSIINIDCDKNGNIIGFKGECLKNIQYIANLVEQRKNHNSKRVVINVGDYNSRHEEKIREMARKKAEKVLKFRRRLKLDPMNAYDRHLVHDELSKMENIKTHSEGIEPNRRLVIEYIN